MQFSLKTPIELYRHDSKKKNVDYSRIHAYIFDLSPEGVVLYHPSYEWGSFALTDVLLVYVSTPVCARRIISDVPRWLYLDDCFATFRCCLLARYPDRM